MLVIGLTGSIGMGKSAAAARLKALGIAVLDADAEVHKLYEGAAVPLIEAAFPGTTADGKVDRVRLAKALARDEDSFKRLEAIVHPLVRDLERRFLAGRAAAGDAIAVLEIPLLYETGAEKTVDAVIVVSASPENQRLRVLERPGMTEERLEALLGRQMPDIEKRRRADFVVDTNGSMAETQAQIDDILLALRGLKGRAFDRIWK